MGLISGFFERRRQRESAIQPGNTLSSEPPPPAEEVKPVGQPVEGVGQGLGPLGMGQDMGVADVFGVLGMIKDAYQSGNIQVWQGSSHVIDLQGDTNTDALREQIMAAMQERGIDPNATPDLLRVLGEHGIDVDGHGARSGMPDTDGDGQPG